MRATAGACDRFPDRAVAVLQEGGVISKKLARLADESRPGRIAWQENVVATLERDKPGTRNQGGDNTPLLERKSGIVSAVQHECRRSDAWQEVAQIEITERLLQPDYILSRR